MFTGITIICVSLIYITMVAIVYFKKQRLQNIENKIYKILIILGIIGLLIELGCCYFVFNKDISSIYNLINFVINKVFLVYLSTWLLTFTIYIFFISFYQKDNYSKWIDKNKKKLILAVSLVAIILLTLVIKLPLYYFNDGTYVYSYGPATNILTYFGVVTIIFDIFCLFINFKNIRSKKYFPLFLLIILMTIASILRETNPSLIIINSMFAFITILMYFTIENPDLQMVNELLRNRELVETSMQEKSDFLFKASQEIKMPIKNIRNNLNTYKISNNEEEKSEIIEIVDRNIDDLSFIINDVLDISTMDLNKVKMLEHNYNLYTFFNDINRKAINSLTTDKVIIKYNINQTLPKSIYGDSLKLKQVIMTIIYNSIKETSEGTIEITVNGIIRYDICRLIIIIRDTGIGMSLDKINELLGSHKELDDSEIKKLDTMDVGLESALKIIKLLGGVVNIKSDVNKGTEYMITIDQRIDETDNKKHIVSTANKKRILLVSDQEIKNIRKELSNYDVDIVSIMLGNDCIEKIKSKESYDLIMLEDEMKPDNAITTLKKIKDLKNVNVPLIVMLNNDKERIKDEYVKDGFKDYYLKDKLKTETKRIMDKYL